MICDQCSKKRKKCSREQPVCYRCAWVGDTCTWERAKSGQKDHAFDKITMVIKRKQMVKSKNKPSCKTNEVKPGTFFIFEPIVGSKKNLGLKDFELDTDMPKNCTTKFTSTSNWNTILLKWTISPALKRVLTIFLKSCAINLTFLTRDDERLIYECLLSKVKFISIPPVAPLHLAYNGQEMKETIKLGTEAYFYYFGSFWPLITYTQFTTRPRSELLKLVIATTGLYFLPRSALRDEVLKFNRNELKSELVPSRLVTCLDTAQALLVASVMFLHNMDGNSTNCMINLASIILENIGFKTTSDSYSELAFARRFVNNIEVTYLTNLYDYSEEYLLCFQEELKVHLLPREICFSIGNWKTMFDFQPRLDRPKLQLDFKQISKLEEIMLVVISEGTTLIYKKTNEVRNFVSCNDFGTVSYLLSHINLAVNFVHKCYQRVCNSLNNLIYKTTAALVSNNSTRSKLSSVLIEDLNLLPILHNFKINVCYAYLQILDVMPKFHYENKLNCDQLYSFSIQSLFYSTKLIDLLQQVTTISPSILHRTRCVFYACRIAIFHRHFLISHFNPDPSFMNFISKAIVFTTDTLDSYNKVPHLSYTVKSFKQTLELIASRYNWNLQPDSRILLEKPS